MTLYKGSQQIKDTGSYGVYKGSTPIGAIYKGSQKLYIFKRTLSWQAGTSLAQYVVPSWVSKIHVDCVGSKGATFRNRAGYGGRVQCDLDVSGGQTLYITVGIIPNAVNVYNASDIRTGGTTYSNRVIVAGGGGGSGDAGDQNGYGGHGGGLVGQAGQSIDKGYGGGGGTQTSGGAGGGHGGLPGWNGSPGQFGLGGYGGRLRGHGGSGWYGGGSAGAGTYYDDDEGGGGGGSSYTNSSCSNVIHTQGYRDGAGYITITEIE